MKTSNATELRKKNQERQLRNMISRRDWLNRMIEKKQLDIEEQEW